MHNSINHLWWSMISIMIIVDTWIIWSTMINQPSNMMIMVDCWLIMVDITNGWVVVDITTIYIVPVVPARGGAEVALGIIKTFLIYRTCMRRAPAKPVRACILRNMSHLKLLRGTFHRRLQPLYTEKHKVSCSAFLPKTSPVQHSCSHYIAFRSVTWLTRISLRTWQQSMWQQSCSQSNAIRNQRFKKRIELRRQEQPLVAEHRGGTNSRMKRPQPQPPHTQGT